VRRRAAKFATGPETRRKAMGGGGGRLPGYRAQRRIFGCKEGNTFVPNTFHLRLQINIPSIIKIHFIFLFSL
jgi:hypothetical protein